jgi:spore maturation protein CgeB
MAAHGFINNRTFDAVFSGARVLSDDVEGITDLFGNSVQTYRSLDELAHVLSNYEVIFPSFQERLNRARTFRTNHSFEQRACVLLHEVEAVLRPRTAYVSPTALEFTDKLT